MVCIAGVGRSVCQKAQLGRLEDCNVHCKRSSQLRPLEIGLAGEYQLGGLESATSEFHHNPMHQPGHVLPQKPRNLAVGGNGHLTLAA